MGCQRRKCKSPGKRIGQKPVQQNQRWPRTGAQVTHSRARHRNPSSTLPPRRQNSALPAFPALAHKILAHRWTTKFIMAALYLSETTPLSLHFGEPYGSPFFRVIVEGMPYSSRAFGDRAKNSRHITPRPKSEVQGLNSEVRSSSYPIISSTPESPCPHASPPSETEAGIAPPYPACC